MQKKLHGGYLQLHNSTYLAVCWFQAQESVLLSEEVRTQLEGVQQRLKSVREEVIENSISREKESFNARRAQVSILEYVICITELRSH